MTIKQIYDILDAIAPFESQESYDNAGILVGNEGQDKKHVLLTLDITKPVIEEAVEIGADMIISHHPVIWDALKSIAKDNPVWFLVKYDIGAICAHTNFDIAPTGLNNYIGQKMAERIGFAGNFEPLEILSGGRTLGYTAKLSHPWQTQEFAKALADIYTNHALRFYDSGKTIEKIAWCSGSGGDLIETALARGADVLITGDCKHSIWMQAQNLYFTLFDCGHFETEVFAVERFAQILHDAAPHLKVSISKRGTTPAFQTI